LTSNLTRHPEFRVTAGGQTVASLSIAETARRRNAQTGQFEDGETSYYTATVWGTAAEDAAESLKRGQRVIVHGRLVERTFTATRGDHQGETIRRLEIVVEEVGVSLRFAIAKPVKTQRGVQPAEADDAVA
jgi:single-strand DNA-binding protein